MTPARRTAFTLALAALAGACSSPQEGGIDAGADAGADSGAAGDAGADAGAGWACPEQPFVACPGSGAYGLWIEAAALGEGWTFVDAAGGGALLAERPDGAGGTEPVLVGRLAYVSDDGALGEHGVAALAAPPAEPLRAIDFVCSGWVYDLGQGFIAADPILGYPAVLLLCGDSECALYALVVEDAGTAWLAPLPGGAVPFADARGLVHFETDHGNPNPADPVCAFGDGLACFDGAGWTALIEPGGPRVLAAALGWEDSATSFLVIAGEGCLLARQTADGFAQIPLGCDADLAVVGEARGAIAAGGDGLLVLALPERTLECPLAGIDLSALRTQTAHDGEGKAWGWAVTALAQDGLVVELRYGEQPEHSACAFADPLAAPALGWSWGSLGTDEYGSLAITAPALYYRSEGSSLIN